jgi:hypothetical protein
MKMSISLKQKSGPGVPNVKGLNMNYREFCVWLFAVACLTLVILSPVACTMKRHERIADAIKSGVDPIAVRCAIEGETQDNLCLIHMIRAQSAASAPN